MCKVLLIATLTISALVSLTIADVPNLINYQGRLTDPAGDPVADGNYQIKFKLYGSETGDDSLWSSGFQTVSVADGLFNYILGSKVAIPSDFFGPGSEPFLGVTIGSDAEIDPRTKITSAIFAYRAEHADTALIAANINCTDCITENHIASEAVTTNEIKDWTITSTDLAVNSIVTNRITNEAVTEEKIAPDAVTTDKIADGTISTADLGQNGAGNGQILKWSGTAWAAANDETGSSASSGWTDNGTAVVTIGTNDSVGIGITAPKSKLHINGGIMLGNNDRDFEFREIPADSSDYISFDGLGIVSKNGTNQQAFIFSDGANSDNIFTISTSQNSGTDWDADFVVQQNGNVGISEDLHVGGNITWDVDTGYISIQAIAFLGENGNSWDDDGRYSEMINKKLYAPVYLPDGATITQIWAICYSDGYNNDFYLRLYLISNTGWGTLDTLGANVVVTSTPDAYVLHDETINNAVVDNHAKSYFMTIFGTDGRIYYAVIEYTFTKPH